MNAWSATTLGSICADGGVVQTGPFGSQLHASDYEETGVPVVMPVNIGDNRIVEAKIARVSESNADRLHKHRLRSGDIVYSRRGDITRRALVRSEAGWLCGTGCLLVRPGASCNAVWLSYWLGTPFVHDWLLKHSVGATMPNLNTSILSALPVNLPSLPEQRRIAGVLGALDDLIDTNERLAESCASLRRATTESALASAEKLFPLSSLAAFVNGRNFTKGATGAGRPVIRTPEVRVGPTESTVRSAVEVSDEFIASRGDILFVWSGSLLLGRWLFETGLINQHIFKVTPNSGIPDWLVYGLIEHQLPWFLGLAADKATTMGHIQRRHLDEPVPVPDAETVRALDHVIQPLWKAEIELAEESQQLRRTRDELLPLLMSGKVWAAPTKSDSLNALDTGESEKGVA